jgi:hypothetical protein
MLETHLKILLLDIETSPNLGWVWGKYQQDIIRFNKEWFILCFAAKWLNDSKIITKRLPDYNLYKKDSDNDRELIKDLWKLLDEADVVVAHNGDEFDIKKVNARIVFHGLPPTSPFKTVDTLKMARRYFGFTSNKLEDLVKSLALGVEKMNTGGFDLWLKCLAGDPSAWNRMTLYNKRDVELLELIYRKLQPWDAYQPNQSVYAGKPICSRCGSNRVQSRGQYVSKTLIYNRFCCSDCGGWMRAYNRNKSVNKPLISV